jgi:hypothetical protein
MRTLFIATATALVLASMVTATPAYHGTFDGTSCYSAPTSTSLDSISSEITFEVWIFPETGGPAVQGIIGTWDEVTGSARSWHLWLSNLTPAVTTVDAAFSRSPSPSVFAASALPTNQWSHVAFTKDAGGAALYVNGVLSATSFMLPASIHVNNRPLRIGCTYYSNSVRYFTGKLDNARVYNVALSDVDIANNAAACGPSTSTVGLVAEYLFDEGIGATLGDTSGNANDAPVSHGEPGWGNGDGTGQSSCSAVATQDPAVAAFCDTIAQKCTTLDSHCVILRAGNYHPTVADDCDASVAACADMHQDCLGKVAQCPVV